MIQRFEDGSSEGNVEEPQPPLPSSVEASAALEVPANIAVFEDTEGVMWNLVFSKGLLGMRQPKLSSSFQNYVQFRWSVISSRFLVDYH